MRWKYLFLPSLAVYVLLPVTVLAQSGGQRGTPGTPGAPGVYDPSSNDPFKTGRPGQQGNHSDDTADDIFLQHRMQETRKVERKKRMVETANRLLVLTQQLQADLKGREATPDDQKRLDEIARLARVVKDQMRN